MQVRASSTLPPSAGAALAHPNHLVANPTRRPNTRDDQEIKSLHLCWETKMGLESQVFPWLAFSLQLILWG